MRKFACLCLALLLAFGGAAMAESVIGGADGPTSILLNWTPSADENRSVLVARLEEDDSYSYALIGAGDGEEEKHAQCPACGGYLCDGKDHTLASCGKHHAGEAGDHTAATCGISGHYTCDGLDHSDAPCGIDGHYTCDGKDHSKAPCGIDGHYTCDGLDHSDAPCGIDGHYTCDGKDHSAAPCGLEGHYTCDGIDHNMC